MHKRNGGIVMNQRQKSALSKIFGVGGALLLWGPILMMVLTAIFGSIANGTFLFDYLMLAELFPLVAFGLVLLVLTSLITHSYAKWVGWGGVAALISLSGGQVFATASGLASGELVGSSFALPIVIASIVIFNLIIVCLAVLSLFLLKQLFQKKTEAEEAD